MGLVALAADRWLTAVLPPRPIGWQIVHVGAAIGAALASLAGAAWILRIHEFNESMNMVTRRFARRGR
jgi:hypothetical protein